VSKIKTYYTANNGKEAIICTDSKALGKFIGCSRDTVKRRLRIGNPFEYKGYFVARTEVVKSKRGYFK
jgi:hypothetical protein